MLAAAKRTREKEKRETDRQIDTKREGSGRGWEVGERKILFTVLDMMNRLDYFRRINPPAVGWLLLLLLLLLLLMLLMFYLRQYCAILWRCSTRAAITAVADTSIRFCM